MPGRKCGRNAESKEGKKGERERKFICRERLAGRLGLQVPVPHPVVWAISLLLFVFCVPIGNSDRHHLPAWVDPGRNACPCPWRCPIYLQF